MVIKGLGHLEWIISDLMDLHLQNCGIPGVVFLTNQAILGNIFELDLISESLWPGLLT